MDDLISRQAAIDVLWKLHQNRALDSDRWIITDCLREIDGLPPAQPEPMKGKWILQSDTYHEYWECDQCGMGVGLDDVRNYCPNCGARMEDDL